jgi:hypothetical protein
MEQRFQARLIGRGPNGAWIFLPVPFNVQEIFGSKARVAVAGTLNGHPFQNSLLPNGDGTHSMPVNKELRAGAKVEAGDIVTVVMALDTAPRSVEIPEDFSAALAGRKDLQQRFAKLSYSMRKEYIDWINEAKKPETRARRIEKAMELLASGGRPK